MRPRPALRGRASRRDDRAAHRLLPPETPALMRDTPTRPDNHDRNPIRDNPTRCAERDRRQGPPAAPRSGYARALTPTPHRRASKDVAAKQEGPANALLTGPAPTGMTCGYVVGDTGFEPVTSSVSRKRATAAPIARGWCWVHLVRCSRWVRDLNPCTRICSPLPRLSANPPWRPTRGRQLPSGRRGSNSRPQPWQGCALPTELRPLAPTGCPAERTEPYPNTQQPPI